MVDKFLMQLEEQLHEKRWKPTPSILRKFLAKKGFGHMMEARGPMQRSRSRTWRSARRRLRRIRRRRSGSAGIRWQGGGGVRRRRQDQIALDFAEALPRNRRIAGKREGGSLGT
ncbi:hypothetical protein ACU4GD_36005 [Cupriavidus basilensis]